jgi:L-ascorbate metabolism protein UlaG (beta-lactamase superfamily)
VNPESLRGTDAVLVSHAHWDHLDLPSLVQLGRDVPIVCPRGTGGLLRRRQFGQVTELEPGGEVRIGTLTITATPAEHDSRRLLGDKGPALGYVVEGSRRIYFAGDTGLFPGMAGLGPLDAALLPVAGWGRKLGPAHLDPRGAAEALRLLRPRLAVPIHWGTYAIGGRHAARGPADEFARRAGELAPEVDVRVLAPGESLEL